MKQHKHAELMLQITLRDLKALQNMQDSERFDDAVYGFFAQQVTEKALKSWLSLIGNEYPKTHDLRLLMNLLEDNGIIIEEEVLHLVDLTDFAVEYRYDLFESSVLDRNSLLKTVEKLVNKIQDLITS